MTDKKRPSLKDTMRKPQATAARSVEDVFAESESARLDRRTTIYLSTPTWKALKVKAAMDETNASQIIEEVLKKHLEL
ncbi:hypothetical protein [Corynebacterium variabile]|uniref:hypothetical protein n=1 Tax=Corynebacterium variabile TaxID=1727 RepID=UPI003BB6C7AB